MANLLSQEMLGRVGDFHRSRFILVGSLALLVGGTIALISLLPLYAFVYVERAISNQSGAPLTDSADADREAIIRAQMLVRALVPLSSSTPSALEILESTLSSRPSGIRVSSMHFTHGDQGTIVIAGTARSREDINAYRTMLAKDPHFKSVSVPIGILTGTEGGRFTATLSGTF